MGPRTSIGWVLPLLVVEGRCNPSSLSSICTLRLMLLLKALVEETTITEDLMVAERLRKIVGKGVRGRNWGGEVDTSGLYIKNQSGHHLTFCHGNF